MVQVIPVMTGHWFMLCLCHILQIEDPLSLKRAYRNRQKRKKNMPVQ